MTDEKQGPLLALPPELRNDIYELVFSDLVIDFTQTNTTTATSTSLLRTCTQIRNEALNIFYHKTTFWAQSSYIAYAFLAQVPSSRSDPSRNSWCTQST
jgi:hypothetical protein